MDIAAQNQDRDWLSDLFKQDLTTGSWVVEGLQPANEDSDDAYTLLDGELAFWLVNRRKFG